MKLLAAAGLCLMAVTEGFYMPGIARHTFKRGAEVDMKVNAMTSIRTQVPKDYYRLPFCQPNNGPKMASENLGEFLTGNKIQNSPYQLNMRNDANCVKLCQITPTKLEAARLAIHIGRGYHHNWIIDNLPSASISHTTNGDVQTHYAGGFPIGFITEDTKQYFIYNHVNIVIEYHQVDGDADANRVVSFSVEPLSINHKFQGGYVWDGQETDGYSKPLETCSSNIHMSVDQVHSNQPVMAGEPILYTYDVLWKSSDVLWASRWDIYLNENHLVPAQVHWYSITNSILVVLFLSLLVVSVLVRNLRRDISGYNAISMLDDEESNDEAEETGWKLVHADVFRPPENYPMMYCVFIGTGVQLALTLLCTIFISAIGFVSPARRGSLVVTILTFYMITGITAGNVSSRLYKAFRGRKWQLCTVLTSVFFPGICFVLFLFFNIILFFFHSSASVPILDIIILMVMWCCVSTPLTFLGAYFGYKKKSMEFPTVTSTIARAIPPPPPLMHPMVGMIATGIVPFAAAYVELFFIMTSLWMDQFYYVFGFTFIVYMILIITCAEVTVLLVYYQLCAENHRWWWYSFFTAGSTALYMFLYSCFWFKSLEASRMLLTYMLFFGYMFLMCFTMLLVTGMIGSMSSLWFIRKIFSSIKVD